MQPKIILRPLQRQRLAARVACLLLACVFSRVSSATTLQEELHRYNALQLSESAQLYGADNGEAEALAGYAFTCHRQADHVPAETAAAKASFQRFVDEVRSHPEPGKDDRQRRMELLNAAIAAGSWRATYFDANWVIWLDTRSPEAREQFDKLWTMAQDGNTAALHGVLRWTNGMYEDLPQRIRILKAAIERGNPQTLSTLGLDLGTRTRKLRPMGIKMLECAAAQGDADAYEGLGRIAWLEGRWVDAYRTWQTGANLGCADCLTQMEDSVLTQPDFSLETGTYGRDSQIAALRNHYESQFLFEISELIELRETAAPKMWLQWTDQQLLAVIKARILIYGLP